MPSSNEPNGDAKIAQGHEVKNSRFMARSIPSVEFTMQNILMSIGTLACSFGTLMTSVFVFLPLSVLRSLMPKGFLTLVPSEGSLKKGKVVLIVGASRGIGMEVLKQYVPEPNTTVIAVARDKGEWAFPGIPVMILMPTF